MAHQENNLSLFCHLSIVCVFAIKERPIFSCVIGVKIQAFAFYVDMFTFHDLELHNLIE